MDLVLLADVQPSYGSNWCRIANTAGVEQVKIGDRFREQGFGPGAEEVEVAGIDLSPVSGASRVFFYRAANATQPMVHRLGAVMERVGIEAEASYEPPPEATGENAVAEPEQVTAEITTTESLVPLKPRRGRPIGSKNKARQKIALPAGFQ